MKLPDFVIFGAQKAGSTFLLEALRRHPQIFMPREEIAFFEASLFDQNKLNEFASNFSAASSTQCIGFKRPNLLGRIESAARMKETLGDKVKLIAILRNPVERAVSAYFHSAATGIVSPKPVDVGLKRILDGQFDHPRAEEILTFGLYGKHLQQFANHFDRNNFCVILLDDIKANVDSALRTCCDFLDVSTDFPPADSNRRPMAAPYSIGRIRIKRTLESVAKTWSENGDYFSFRKGVFWQYYMKAVRGIDQMLLKRLFPSRRPRLAPELASQLREYYASDVELLSGWLGRDLSHWLKDEEVKK